MLKKILLFAPLLFCVLFAVFVPLVSPYPATFSELTSAKIAPNSTHFFGTTLLGRDLFTQIAYGLRVSLFVGFVAAFMSVVLGVLFVLLARSFFIAFLYEVWTRF